MDRNILQEKLNQPFDSDRWKEVVEGVFRNVTYFAKERILPSDDGIVDQFVEKGTVRLKDGKNLALFEVRVAGNVNLPRARVKLRNLVAKYIDQETHYGVLAVFDQGGEDYRLSFVAKESELVDGEFIAKETPAKRYTYLLGSNESCRTAAERLAALSEKAEATLDDIINAFSVERLNKEFYKDIQKHFYRLVGGKVENKEYTGCLALPSRKPEDNHQIYQEFAVRLIGRVIFCWFLKHKRCDKDRPLIPEELLSSMAIEEHAGYYHAILEKLFFQTLNKPMNSRSKYAPEFAHLIPYLNGGLFDPKPHDFYEEGALGASKYAPTLQVPDDWFLNLFKCLEQYNFTIDENTSLDSDVSIDPEILGRIFENLLAEINPETGDSARKATGSFYTPREIVDYMVEESLVQHLKTSISQNAEIETKFRALFVDDDNPHGLDEQTRKAVVDAFRTIKVLDPACGSGAFPVGILQKMLCALRKVDPDNDLWLTAQINQIHDMKLDEREQDRRLDEIEHAFKTNEADYGRKLGIIQNSVYGVDIQPVAIEIAKLRFFLTLVVDEKIEDDEYNRGILPLPNLDFKFVAANTLIPAPEIENQGDELDLEYYPDFFADFTALTEQYFYAGTPSEKQTLRDQLAECVGKKIHGELDKVHSLQGIDLFALEGLSKAKQKNIKDRRTELVRNISLWESYKNIFTGDPVGFFDPQYMFPDASNGFDVVIANPPYVRQEEIKEYKPAFSQTYDCYTGTADLLIYFYEQGCRLLKDNGVLTYITSNKYFRAGYGDKLRGYLTKNMRIHQLIDFGDAPVFDATAYPSIIVMSKGAVAPSSKLLALNWTPGDPVAAFVDIFRSRAFPMKQSYLTSDGWKLEQPHIFNLMQKLRDAGTPLGEYVDGKFYYGIKTGYNEAFVIDRATRDRLIAEDPNCEPIIKPFLRGRDVKRWRTEPQDLWLINTHTGYGDTPAIDIEDYPVLKAHLDDVEKRRAAGEFGEKAQKAKGLYKRDDQGKTPYNLRNCVYVPEFEKPKIVIPAITNKANYAFDDEGYFGNDKTNICVTDDGQYILGLLNSSIGWWFIQQTASSRQNGFFEFKPMYVMPFPVATASSSQKEEIESRVEQILTIKKELPDADVSELEAEIDQLVYNLYGLTEEEIAIVESAGFSPSMTKPLLQEKVIAELKKAKSYFSIDEIKSALETETGEHVPDSTVKTYLSDFMANGTVYDAGKGWYSKIANPLKLSTEPLEQILKVLQSKFPLMQFSCWSTEQINPYMHHLLARFTTFVHVPGSIPNALEIVGDALRGSGYNVLVNPGKPDIRQYYSKLENPVILRTSGSKEPESAQGISPPEKVLVDLLVENLRLDIMEESEAEEVVKNAVTVGRVNMASFLSYAKRRDVLGGLENIYQVQNFRKSGDSR